MKRIILIVSISLLMFPAWAQEQEGSISGTVNEEGSGSPAAFATMVLLDADSIMVKADFTKEDGSFSFIKIPAGSYQLQMSSVQYEAYQSGLFELAPNQDLKLDPIAIKGAVTQLEDVQVTAVRPLVEVQPDKTVFNVEGSVNATGNDGMELLRKAPGVIVDNNDNIILQGKNGVLIYIDGKPTQLRGEDLVALLRSLQSEDIESLDIITNPSAKYDAEGNAGIIDIKLKRDKNLGMNATITAGYDIGKKKRYRGGITANYRNKKTSLFGNYTYYDNAGTNETNLFKELNGNFLDQRSNSTWTYQGHNFRGGADYYINKKHTIGFVVNGSLAERGGTTNSTTPFGSIATGEVDQILQANNRRDFGTDNLQTNINYQYSGEKGSSLNVDADYGYYWNEGGLYQPNLYLDPTGEVVMLERNFTDEQVTRIDIRTFKADYETNIGKGKVSAGIKWSDVETANTYDFFSLQEEQRIKDIDRSSAFDYREKVAAAYLNYSQKFGEKYSLSAGVRAEHTDSDGKLESEKENEIDEVKRSYTDFFPSGGITYEPNKTHKFAFNYSRRIDRPGYKDLNPFEFKLDELTFQRGNPFLNPQYTNSFQVSHTYKYKLTSTLSYSHTNDFFAIVTDTTGERGSLISQQNIADARNLGLNVSYPFDVTKWWSVYSNLNLYHVAYDANIDGATIDLNQTTYNLYMQNSFVLPKDLKLEVSGWYNSPSVWGGTFETEAMWSLDIGFKKSLFKDRGTLSVNLTDVFKTQEWEGFSEFAGLRINGNGGYDSRRLKFGLTYRVGNQQVKGARKRKTGLEDEQNRIKDS